MTIWNTSGARSTASRLTAATFLLVAWSTSSYAQVQIDAQASVSRNDNINLAFEGGNETEETVQSVASRFFYNGSTRYTRTSLFGNLAYSRYLNDFFDDDLAGGAALNFDAISGDGRFRWTLTDNYGQQSVDPTQLATPQNRRDVNIFRTGPSANFQLSSRNTLQMSVVQTLTTVADSNTDTSRLTGGINFTRQLNNVFSATIGGNYEAVEFDDIEGFDFDNRSISASVTAVGRRNTISVTVGQNEIEGNFGESDNILYNIRYSRQLGANSNLTMQIGRAFSDAGNLFRLTQRNTINVGSAQDIIATAEPFENSTGFVTFSRGGLSSSMALQAFWRKDDFETQSQFNRNEFGARAFIRQSVGEKWELQLDGGSVRRDLQGLRQEDDTHVWSVQAMRDLGRSFGVGLRFVRIMRDQNRDGFDRNSNQITLFFNYRRQRGIVDSESTNQVF